MSNPPAVDDGEEWTTDEDAPDIDVCIEFMLFPGVLSDL